MIKKLKIIIFIRQSGDYDWVSGFLRKNISRADFTIYLHAGTSRLAPDFATLIREEFSSKELEIICGPIVPKYLDRCYEYIFRVVDKVGRKFTPLKINLSSFIRPILKFILNNSLRLGGADVILVSNSHHRDLSFETICALSPAMKLVIFPHAPGIFSAFVYSKTWILNDFDLWIESCCLSDWSLSHDRSKVAFVGLQDNFCKYKSQSVNKKNSIILILQKRADITGMSLEELRKFFYSVILKSKSYGMSIDIKQHPHSNYEMNSLAKELRSLGCKILPPILKKTDYLNYHLCIGMWSTFNIYFVAAGIPVLVVMPEKYNSNLTLSKFDVSFYFDNAKESLTNKYFDSGLVHRISSTDELDSLLSDKSALDALYFEQQESFSRYWPYSEMFDVIQKKLF